MHVDYLASQLYRQVANSNFRKHQEGKLLLASTVWRIVANAEARLVMFQTKRGDMVWQMNREGNQ